MLFASHPVLIRGGGDLGTGIAYRLKKTGFPVIVFEQAHPLVVRRRVALASAVFDGDIFIEDLHGHLYDDLEEAFATAQTSVIPVLIHPEMPSNRELTAKFKILVDARMAKRNIDTRLDQAALVIGLGPGFTAGYDCHAVIETMRGHRLGRVIWDGPALPNSGTPGTVQGKDVERVLRASIDGVVLWACEIGDYVVERQVLGRVAEQPILAPFDGVARGLIAPGTRVSKGLKIGDIDPRNDSAACFTISDKALAVGGGALTAILSWMDSKGLNLAQLQP